MSFHDHTSQELAFPFRHFTEQTRDNMHALFAENPPQPLSPSASKPLNFEDRSEEELGGESWEGARCKADILAHPLYEQLLSAHVSCLRIATPVDQLPRLDAQLAQSQEVVSKYSLVGGQPVDEKELDQFMVRLLSFLSCLTLQSGNVKLKLFRVYNKYQQYVKLELS